MIEAFVNFLLHFAETLGYGGIFIMTMLESTFLPIPSEITMIPAGYLIYQGKMDPIPLFLVSVSGTVTGALINYYIAFRYGRKLLLRHQKIFRITEEKMEKMEKFFINHGPISIFTGRLVFGVRHYISFPAGLAHMNLKLFCLYTAAGGSIWTATLLLLGYLAGGNEDFLASTLPVIKTAFLLAVAVALVFYIRRHKKTKSPS